MMNKYLELYLKAYTNKVAADDSIVDDAAVGVGGAAAGGALANKLFSNKVNQASKLKDKLVGNWNNYTDRSSKLREGIHKSNDLRHLINKNQDKNGLSGTAAGRNKINAVYDLVDKKLRPKLLDIEKKARISSERSLSVNKLLQRIKAKRMKGVVGGAIGAGALGTLLYNRLNKD